MWLLFGVIICAIITVMHLTNSFNLECFYDAGDVYRVSNTEFMVSGSNWVYDYNTESINITEEIATKAISIRGSQKNWKFLYLELEGLQTSSDWNIYFWNENWEAIGLANQKMQNGLNIIPIEPEEIYAVNFEILNQQGLNFVPKKMQFREQLKPFEWKEFVTVFGITFCLYLLLSFAAYQWKKRKGTRRRIMLPWVEGVQNFYGGVLESGAGFCQKLSVQVKAKIRSICFFLCFIDIHLAIVKNWRWQILIQRKQVTFLGACLLVIAFISWEGKKKDVSWRNSLVYGWFALWILCIVSEFVVQKSSRAVGFFMILAVTPFYLSWNQMERPQDLLVDLKRAMRWYYWLGCIFCIVCRPADIGYRYMGLFPNPNTFAAYLTTLNLVFLDDMNEALQKRHVKYKEFLENAAGLVSVVCFLQWTQSVTSFAAYAVVMLLFFWRQFLNRKKEGYGKNVIKSFCAVMLSSLLIATVGKWCLINAAEIFDTVVSFPNDIYEIRNQVSPASMVVHAANNQGIAIFQRISLKLFSHNISLSLSGRDTIWIDYLQNLNLFGHQNHLECSGMVIAAHNNFLQMMHIYGVFVLLPYVVMFYFTIKNSMKNLWNGQKMSLFVAGAVLNFHVIGIAESVTTPYSFACWLTFYIVIGSLFCASDERREIRR